MGGPYPIASAHGLMPRKGRGSLSNEIRATEQARNGA